ncbi:MAG: gliding motility protein [Leadbetterella sp.]|nr:gliding motility protein [Leadbetterella sp.]
MFKRVLFFLLILAVFGCGKDSDAPETPVTIERFDRQLMAVKSEAELQKLLEESRTVKELLFGVSAVDTAFTGDIFHMVQHADARKLYDQTQETFGDLESMELSFARAFDGIRKLYPDFTPPRIVAGFSGLRNDMVVTDSMVVISLESFIGPKALYRPDQPDYVLRRFAPEYVVPNVIRFLSNRFNKVDFTRDSFTEDMIFFGKSLEFSRAVLPHVEDSLIIGYSNREMQNAYENQDVIWAHIIDRELLNSENPAVNAKYFGERPYTGEISGDCPGRIGQWLGWRIVELYRLKNPDVPFQELMRNEDAGAILRGSKYRGQKDD